MLSAYVHQYKWYFRSPLLNIHYIPLLIINLFHPSSFFSFFFVLCRKKNNRQRAIQMMKRAFVCLQAYGNQGMPFGMANTAASGAALNDNTSPSKSVQLRSTHRSPLDPSTFVEARPRNSVFNIVPQGHEYVVERLGRYHRTLDSGWWVVIPFVDKIRYNYNIKEQGIEIPNQSAITSDNVVVEIDGVLFLKIVDSQKASYNIENPIWNLMNLAQTTMRSEIGRMTLDNLFNERANLNRNIVEVLRKEASEWGIECKRYEIRDIVVSELVRRSMDLQAEAERIKRKVILESEGDAVAEVNHAKGLRSAQEIAADAQKYTVLRDAEAQAEAIRMKSKAIADNIAIVAEQMKKTDKSNEAVSLRVAELYLEKFGQLAKETNTVVLSQPVSDPATFSTQALSVFNAVATSAAKGGSLPIPGK
ncbi:stomatin-like protein [Strigomonas culicis]|uniref:Stomatin-like protein n=1 Tax=Strigomonas culicis TaxID=28005 RepID=S9U374_9TRYP|nr:stomatin-like protein [Strigomonas culicis]|eukprot:EPY23239.1 stomatin-like protein [Strigomonas culicis]